MTTPIELVKAAFGGCVPSGTGYKARCPAHDDRHESLTFAEADGGKVLLHCHAGCDPAAVVSQAGLKWGDLFPGRAGQDRWVVGHYVYRDEGGKPLYRKVRYEPKSFGLERAAGSGWQSGLGSARRVLYRLDELTRADPRTTVFVVEGEKDADRLASLGLLATTSPLGAGRGDPGKKWLPDFSHCLALRDVVILPDNDQVGREFAAFVAFDLHQVGPRTDGYSPVRSVKVVDLPGLGPKEDVSDWLDRHGTVDALLQLAAGAPEWRARRADPCPPEPAEDFDPFPVGALPAPLDCFVESLAAALMVDNAYVALPALAMVAAAIGDTRAVRIKRSWTEPSILWLCILGLSSTGKSPAFRQALAPVHALEMEAGREFADKLAQYQEDKKEDRSTPKPTRVRKVIKDATVEAVAARLADSPRGLLLARDELASWFASFDRYRKNPGATGEHHQWIEFHAAQYVSIDRKDKDRPTIEVPRAVLNVVGTTQPQTLRKVATDSLLDSGFLGRILFAHPPAREKVWREDDLPEGVEEALASLVARLYGLSHVEGKNGEPLPVLVDLSAEAKAAWVRFYEGWAKVQHEEQDPHTKAAYGKLEGYAARFALIHHVITHIDRDGGALDKVGPESMLFGERLTYWFARELRRALRGIRELEGDKEVRDILQKAAGGLTARDLHKANRSKYPTPARAETALNDLVRFGHGEWRESPAGAAGRPTRVFYPASKNPVYPETPRGAGKAGPETHAPVYPETHAPTQGTPETPEENGVSGYTGFLDAQAHAPEAAETPPGVSGYAEGVSGQTELHTPYRLVTTPEGLDRVVQAVGGADRVALDCETHGTAADKKVREAEALDPRTATVRLIQVGIPGEVFVVDCRAVDPSPLLGVLGHKEVVAHNAPFDIGVLTALGMEPPPKVIDTKTLSSLLTARGTYAAGEKKGDDGNSLKDLAKRYLALDLDKKQQTSDWSAGDLTPEQIAYAAADVDVLLYLVEVLRKEIKDAGLGRVAGIELRAAPAVLWMCREGAGFDAEVWRELTEYARGQAGEARAVLDSLAPPRPVPEELRAWDFGKANHCREALKVLGLPHQSASVKALRGINHPFAQTLLALKTTSDNRVTGELEALAPPRPVPEEQARWNWNSDKQVREAFTIRLGKDPGGVGAEARAGIQDDLVEAFGDYQAANQLVKQFGDKWASRVEGGRVYPEWKQTGSAAGRMSCSNPNLQQVPRDPRYRACVRAPEGRVLVWADYSQIELRLAAQISGDEKMLAAYREGQDLHTLTAAALLDKDPADVTKAERQLAKAQNFGNLYGAGPKQLMRQARKDYGVEMTEEEAKGHQAKFRQTYPQLRAWQTKATRAGKPHPHLKDARGYALKYLTTRTLLGRRRLSVHKYTEKLNSPVQGSGADGLKLALALLWERRDRCPIAFPVLAVHDEIVVETDDDPEALEATKAWLAQAMKDGMGEVLKDCPVEVEATHGRCWGK